MTKTNPRVSSALEDAFYELSLSGRTPDARVLDDLVRRFPKYATELTEFAVSLALDGLSPEVPSTADSSKVSSQVSRAVSKFQNRLHEVQLQDAVKMKSSPATEVANPFASLDRARYREFAKQIGANSVFVNKLRDRQVSADTIPDGFKRLVAKELNVPHELVAAHFSAKRKSVQLVRQHYKSDAKPTSEIIESFADAVRSSGLTEEQQKRLLNL